MLKNKIVLLTIVFFLILPKVSLSQEIDKIYSFNEDFEIISKDSNLIEIKGDFEKDLIGFYYKNIKIYYEDSFEFLSFKILYKDKKNINSKLKLDIKFGGNYVFENINSFLPTENVIFIGNFEKSVEKFLLFKYYPFIFNEAHKEGYLLKSFDIKVNFKRKYSPLSDKKIFQPETYLIIGKSSIKDTIDFFIKKRSQDGFNVIFKPIEDFSIGDVKINIRNYLKENYKNLNIKYLLLIGESNTIPYFKVYPYKNQFVLTDFFYGELTSELDLDKDGKLGEPLEDKIDFYSEISVGRIPSSDVNFVKEVLDRTLLFETLNNKKTILMAGAIWNFETTLLPFTDGAESLKIIFDETYKKNDFSMILLSEKEGVKKSEASNTPISYENLIIYQNDLKPGLILWQGHGYFNSTFRKIWLEDLNNNGIFEDKEGREIKFVDIDSLISFDKDYPSIVFMGSCDNMKGIENSLAYSFIKDYAVSVIAATDTAYYGIDWKGFNSGWLQSLMYSFSDYLKDGNSVSYSLSKAKEIYFEKFISPVKIEESFANIYVFNIFGPPEVNLKTENKFIKTNSVIIKENQIFKVEFKITNNINTIKGLIEFDNEIIKFFKIESKNSFNYSFIDENRIMFKIDKIFDKELFSMIFFGKKPGETNIILRGIVVDEKFNYDIIESNKIFILKKKYSKYDLNDDGKVDGIDLIEFSKSFGTLYGDKDYKDYCDFTMDGRVDGLDLIEFSKNFGKIFNF